MGLSLCKQENLHTSLASKTIRSYQRIGRLTSQRPMTGYELLWTGILLSLRTPKATSLGRVTAEVTNMPLLIEEQNAEAEPEAFRDDQAPGPSKSCQHH